MIVIPPGPLDPKLFDEPNKEVMCSIEKPIKIWLPAIEMLDEGCLIQAAHLANLPFLHSHAALMADAHYGYGMPIGGVIATEDVVIPNAVGVDVGCGMLGVRLRGLDPDHVKSMRDDIIKEILYRVPVGFKHHKTPKNDRIMEVICSQLEIDPHDVPYVTYNQWDAAHYQLGTLGGGNHFIEAQRDEEDCVWLMIHSGSRNLGKQIADWYNKQARELNKRWFSQVPDEWQLAFIPRDETHLFENYLKEMNIALEFAFHNRLKLLDQVDSAIAKVLEKNTDQGDILNIHHNYASLENHKGKNVYVHRKGATMARENTIGIIPGSMGTRSYIVKGLGNPESFNSCSHGAGRAMGRNDAKRNFTAEHVIESMKSKDVALGKPSMKDVAEECDEAYKDIDEVMENQKDLVGITHTLKPILVVKG